MSEFKPSPISPEAKTKLEAVKSSLLQQYTWPFPIVNGKPVQHGVNYVKAS